MLCLNSAPVRAPNVFVQLQLIPDGQAVGKYPFRQLGVLDPSVDGGHQYRAFLDQGVLVQDRLGPVVIRAIGDDDFEFVRRRELLKIAPDIFVRHARGWTLDVHDALHARVDPRDVQAAGGFQQNFIAAIAQRLHEEVDRRLQQRLAAGDFQQAGRIGRDGLDDGFEVHPPASRLGKTGVAPGAIQMASGQPDKNAGAPGMGGFALNAKKYFADVETLIHADNIMEYMKKTIKRARHLSQAGVNDMIKRHDHSDHAGLAAAIVTMTQA